MRDLENRPEANDGIAAIGGMATPGEAGIQPENDAVNGSGGGCILTPAVHPLAVDNTVISTGDAYQ